MLKEFSIKGYKSLLETVLASEYRFVFFNEHSEHAGERLCLMRHDIDADLEAAKAFAVAEHALGAKATYFVMLRSPVYNLFARHNHRCIEKILSLGHSLALHYDEAFYPDNKKALPELVESEATVLEKAFDCKITTVSFHQPGPKVLANEIKIPQYINTYDKQDMEGIFYMSDSNMNWKEKDPWALFGNKAHQKIQILTHPMWWMGDGEDNTETLWNKALLDNFNRNLDQVIQTEAAFGPPRKIKNIELL